jgi:hypothetical protein
MYKSLNHHTIPLEVIFLEEWETNIVLWFGKLRMSLLIQDMKWIAPMNRSNGGRLSKNTINWLICIDIMIDILERGNPLSIFKEGKYPK